jgi:hypothetical protein
MNKKSTLTRFGPAQIVASVSEDPQLELGLQISRVLLAFANGNKLILTVNLRYRVGVAIGQPTRMVSGLVNSRFA